MFGSTSAARRSLRGDEPDPSDPQPGAFVGTWTYEGHITDQAPPSFKGAVTGVSAGTVRARGRPHPPPPGLIPPHVRRGGPPAEGLLRPQRLRGRIGAMHPQLKTALAAAAVLGTLAAAAGAGGPAYPSAIAVIGGSDAVGYASDPNTRSRRRARIPGQPVRTRRFAASTRGCSPHTRPCAGTRSLGSHDANVRDLPSRCARRPC